MYKRFRSSLFNPKEIANYRYDKIYITVIYFFFLVLISMIPFAIEIIQTDGLTYNEKVTIKTALRKTEIPYKIEDNVLVKTKDTGENYFIVSKVPGYEIIFLEDINSPVEEDAFNFNDKIILTKTKVYYHIVTIQKSIELFEYKDYPNLNNIEFTEAVNTDEFYDIIFPIINKEIDNNALYMTIYNLVFFFISMVFELIITSLIFSYFQRKVLPQYKFSNLWKLIIYTLTPFVIIQLIDNLFHIGFLFIISIIITIVYANILSQELAKK